MCGATHDGLPLDWGFEAPAYWDESRHSEAGMHDGSDLCVVPHEGETSYDYFVRGLIKIPITDGSTHDEEYFGIGAWASLSETNFTWYVNHFEADAEEQGEAWFGWLSNSIPVYPETLSLRTDVTLLGQGLRPSIRIQAAEHPLSKDQRNGITLAHARELSARWLHS